MTGWREPTLKTRALIPRGKDQRTFLNPWGKDQRPALINTPNSDTTPMLTEKVSTSNRPNRSTEKESQKNFKAVREYQKKTTGKENESHRQSPINIPKRISNNDSQPSADAPPLAKLIS